MMTGDRAEGVESGLRSVGTVVVAREVALDTRVSDTGGEVLDPEHGGEEEDEGDAVVDGDGVVPGGDAGLMSTISAIAAAKLDFKK